VYGFGTYVQGNGLGMHGCMLLISLACGAYLPGFQNSGTVFVICTSIMQWEVLVVTRPRRVVPAEPCMLIVALARFPAEPIVKEGTKHWGPDI
jgi:hypothetical protein